MRSRCATDKLRRFATAVAPAASLMASAYLMATAVESSATYWWLGWVALLPLFFAIRVLSPLRAMSCGALWGGSLFLFTLAAETKIAPTPGSLALLTAVPGAYAYLGAWLTQRCGFSPLALAFLWIGVEFGLRPLGLQHGLLAGTLGDGSGVLHVVGSFAGYVLVAFLVAYVNAWLLSIVGHVQTAAGTARVFSRSDDGVRPLVPLDVPCFLFQLLLQPSRPRGPPALGIA